MILTLYFAVLLGTLLQIVASSLAQFSSNHSLRRDDIDPDWPYSLVKSGKDFSVSQALSWPD